MADDIMKGSTELDAITPEFWSSSFFPTLLASLPFNDSVAREYEGEIQGLGDTLNVPSIPAFDFAEDLAEDAKADADSTTVAKTALVINHQLVKDFIITRKGQRQSIDAQIQLRNLALYSILAKMQSLIVADIVPSASSPDHTIAFTTGTTFALADFLAAKELLDVANVPDDGRRTTIMGAPQWNDLFNITGFISRDYIPNTNMNSSGAIPMPLLGFQPKYTTAIGDVAYLFHPAFMQLAVQENPAVEVFNMGVEGKRATRINMTALFGNKQLSNVRVVQIG